MQTFYIMVVLLVSVVDVHLVDSRRNKLINEQYSSTVTFTESR